MPNITAFLSYVLVSTFTPGPNNIMSMSNASRYGFKKSIFFNIGVLFGFFIIMTLCSIFSVALYNLLPSIKPVMTILGAVYILWLAFKILKSKPAYDKENETHTTTTFIYGFLLQFANLKVILYGITIVSTFIVPYYNSYFILVFFSFFLALTGFISTCCWSLFGSIFHKFFNKNYKTINIVMALLLTYCAVTLFH